MPEITITRSDGTTVALNPLPTEERDIALGRYMDAFSRLELMVSIATNEILQIDHRTGSAIAAVLMTKQAIDLLEASARLALNEVGIARVTKICEKLKNRNMRRNHIVHGIWQMAVIINDDSAEFEWVRWYQRQTHPEIVDHRDPKLLGIYSFTIPELHRVTGHVEEISPMLSALIGDIPSLRVPQQTP